ncbi:MAG TPA: hypothetical protein VGH33_25100 [Isosphaeraceae bacterium]
MKSFLLASSLPALFAFGCSREPQVELKPIADAPKPATATTTPQGKKVTKPPLMPARSPFKTG